MHNFCWLFVLLMLLPQSVVATSLPDNTWFKQDESGRVLLHVYFYWSNKCPHCLEALPYVEMLADERDQLRVHAYQLVGEPDNVARYQWMMRSLEREAQSVPAFVFCNTVLTGYDANYTPQQIETLLGQCRKYIEVHGSLANYSLSELEQTQIVLPFFGEIAVNGDSLPFMTLVIAGVDAFNPCAFFVLMFLMSMMLHTRKRSRMLLVGGMFVFISGLLYFLFMAAWLNLFRAIGQLELITIIAALIAIVVGVINVKDFIWFKKGVSLTISDNTKPALYQRARLLLQARSLPTMLVATVGLALFANLYEFLCTAGFPMVYTRILTLSKLSDFQYYMYLAFYNLVYIMPLLLIVLLFTWTMGKRQLQETEGRRLKLISGTMMLALGLVLLVDPSLLQNLLITLFILITAVVLALAMIKLDKLIKNRNRSNI